MKPYIFILTNDGARIGNLSQEYKLLKASSDEEQLDMQVNIEKKCVKVRMNLLLWTSQNCDALKIGSCWC